MLKKKNIKKKKIPLVIKKITLLTIQCNRHNTLVYLQHSGKDCLNISSGTTGLKGSKRSTVYAAQQTLLLLIEKLKEKNIKVVILFFKGFGRGRRSIIKGLKKNKIKVLRIFDKTPIAHNGCRVSKKRRL
jgi:small subunit ribosomal protein S11